MNNLGQQTDLNAQVDEEINSSHFDLRNRVLVQKEEHDSEGGGSSHKPDASPGSENENESPPSSIKDGLH